MKKRRKEECDK